MTSSAPSGSRGGVDEVAEELSTLLRCDRTVVKVFLLALSSASEISEAQIGIFAGSPRPSPHALAEEMLSLGLLIRGMDGLAPVHPRLGISNLYRIALAKDESVRAGRVRVDQITALLVKRREEVLGFAK